LPPYKKGAKMDREEQIINLIKDLTDVVTGIQNTLGIQIEIGTHLKKRIERLEQDIEVLKRG
jgi:phage shock protein A